MSYLRKADEALARARAKPSGQPPNSRTVRGRASEQGARDPWRHALAGIEDMPDTPGKVARINGEIRIASRFILNDVLGLSNLAFIDVLRLGRVMRYGLNWDGPKAQWMGERKAKGYAKVRKGYTRVEGADKGLISASGRRRLLAG